MVRRFFLLGLLAASACSGDARSARRTLRDSLSSAPAAAHARSFFVPTPIAPMPDRPGTFAMRRRGSTTFFTPSGFALSLESGDRRWSLHCTLVGARDAAPTGEAMTHARVHHYIGATHATGLPVYGRVAWDELYPGVDMVAEPSHGGFDYRFALSPGARLADVVMHWSGATAVRAVDQGRGLDIETSVGVLRVRDLHAFAIEGEHRVELPARHVVRDGDVSIEVDGWTGGVPLVLDPTVSWSSFLGGSDTDGVAGIAVDGSGNVLVTGYTTSTNFPTTSGLDATLGGPNDVFVAAMTSSGTLLWSTYLGGGSSEQPAGIAVAGSDVWVAGYTQSSDFPTSGFDTTLGGTTDAWVARLSSTGTLAWSSYLGGADNDFASRIAIDGSGSALLVGQTQSIDFPVSGGCDTTRGGTGDTFVTKISSAGAVVWSSYLGGSGTEASAGLAVDPAGNVLIAGSTNSPDFPTLGAFDNAWGGGYDGFVAKVSPAGALTWSSYLGGAGDDRANAIAADSSGNAIVAGTTYSDDFPKVGAFAATRTGQESFVTKVTGGGTLSWSSYLGGSGTDYAFGIGADSSGDVVIVGGTYSSNFPTLGGFDTTLGGSNDVAITKVSAAGRLLWSSFLGGSSGDDGRAVAFDSSGNAWIAGNTNSSDFPSTGGFDTTLSGYSDAFVTSLRFDPLGAACALSSACRSGYCVDGVCCDTACAGRCEACTTAKKGSGADGACAPIADGTDPEKECAAQSCSFAGVSKAQLCNGAGACRSDGTISCGLFTCSGADCGTSCTTDSQCVFAAHCSGTTCAADLDAGATCARASQCKSGFCVDGVCCDKACGGPCEACTSAMKGSGADGACGLVAADTDPHARCAVGTEVCGADGVCDGVGACRSYAKTGTACGATTCVAGLVIGKVCKGDAATCIDSPGVKCSPYACDTSACKTSCTTDADCDTAVAFCSSTGACVAKIERGKTCKEGRECASGHCTDGTCCESPCGLQCESCSEAGTEGTCTPVLGKPRGARAACDALPDADCAKTVCDGRFREKCAGYANGPTVACGADACTDDKRLQRAGSCDGAGRCSLPAPLNCTPYICDLASTTGCKTTCTTKVDCSAGYNCVDGACTQSAACNDDKSASIDKLGKSTPCAPFRCGPAGTCLSECAASDDCASGNVCDPASKICVPPAEQSTGDDGGCNYGARGVEAWWLIVVALIWRRRVS